MEREKANCVAVDKEAAQGQTIDPIADLFRGIRFRSHGDSHIVIADVRNYCKKLQHDTFIEGEQRVQRAIQELNAERREVTFRCESLEAAIRQIKRHQAEEIIDAISSKPGAEMVAEAPRRRY